MAFDREQVHRLQYFNNMDYYWMIRRTIDPLNNMVGSQKHVTVKNAK